jgi:spore coat polysaccharide biosynthesis protein SpsF (cytidylyltransferase family)
MTTAVIVQARMRSTRLPGKILRKLAGRTVLERVLARCAAIRGIDLVCCATPDSPDSDPVAEEARRCGAVVVRGPENDVLARYDKAAREIGADVVMRVTSDCPLTDPDVDAQVLELFFRDNADYAANNLAPGWPHGLDCEVFTAAALSQAAGEAREPHQREHVTPWLRSNPRLRRAHLPWPESEPSQLRWTLDYEEDLSFFSAVFEKLPSSRIAGYREVMELLARHPEVVALNAARIDALRFAGGGRP